MSCGYICDTWPPHGFEQNSLQNLFRLRTNTQYLVVNRYQWDTSPENPSMKPSWIIFGSFICSISLYPNDLSGSIYVDGLSAILLETTCSSLSCWWCLRSWQWRTVSLCDGSHHLLAGVWPTYDWTNPTCRTNTSKNGYERFESSIKHCCGQWPIYRWFVYQK